jgi:hypothetical protein
LASYDSERKYGMFIAFLMFIVFSITPLGIYTGFKYKTDEPANKLKNTTGLVGNSAIFLFVPGLMLYAALM